MLDFSLCRPLYWFLHARSCQPLLQRLRWATLGYHHDWDTKVYSHSNVSPFPSELAELTSALASAAGFEAFRSEAAIVNFYGMDSTLCGHTDHSEQNMEAPLFSISIGRLVRQLKIPCINIGLWTAEHKSVG